MRCATNMTGALSSHQRLPQYRTQIDGVGIHFIHVRLSRTRRRSFSPRRPIDCEFMEVIGPLSDPARYGKGGDSFHVVVRCRFRALPSPTARVETG